MKKILLLTFLFIGAIFLSGCTNPENVIREKNELEPFFEEYPGLELSSITRLNKKEFELEKDYWEENCEKQILNMEYYKTTYENNEIKLEILAETGKLDIICVFAINKQDIQKNNDQQEIEESNNISDNNQDSFEEETKPCVENWVCSEWGSCIQGKKERNCVDLSNCKTINNKPLEKEDCEIITGCYDPNKNIPMQERFFKKGRVTLFDESGIEISSHENYCNIGIDGEYYSHVLHCGADNEILMDVTHCEFGCYDGYCLRDGESNNDEETTIHHGCIENIDCFINAIQENKLSSLLLTRKITVLEVIEENSKFLYEVKSYDGTIVEFYLKNIEIFDEYFGDDPNWYILNMRKQAHSKIENRDGTCFIEKEELIEFLNSLKNETFKTNYFLNADCSGTIFEDTTPYVKNELFEEFFEKINTKTQYKITYDTTFVPSYPTIEVTQYIKENNARLNMVNLISETDTVESNIFLINDTIFSCDEYNECIELGNTNEGEFYNFDPIYSGIFEKNQNVYSSIISESGTKEILGQQTKCYKFNDNTLEIHFHFYETEYCLSEDGLIYYMSKQIQPNASMTMIAKEISFVVNDSDLILPS